jgi:hypothetical protein
MDGSVVPRGPPFAHPGKNTLRNRPRCVMWFTLEKKLI